MCAKKILLLVTALYLGTVIVAQAQKLANVQKSSIFAPAKINIDGKATEWNNKFEAYNKATDIYYTICNDDSNFYLVIQASDPDVLTKITNRGVVLSINSAGDKKDDNTVSVTYPVFDVQYGNKPYIRFTNSGMYDFQRQAMEQNPDSVSRLANKKLRANEKFIRTNGIQGVDTLLSVYNQNGIVAAEAFDNKMFYTYELSLPLKYLNISNNSKFKYHIMLPGIDVFKDLGYQITKRPDGVTVASLAPGSLTVRASHIGAVTATTDFWGEYVLAKKSN